jgi:hypothetical protein
MNCILICVGIHKEWQWTICYSLFFCDKEALATFNLHTCLCYFLFLRFSFVAKEQHVRIRCPIPMLDVDILMYKDAFSKGEKIVTEGSTHCKSQKISPGWLDGWTDRQTGMWHLAATCLPPAARQESNSWSGDLQSLFPLPDS